MYLGHVHLQVACVSRSNFPIRSHGALVSCCNSLCVPVDLAGSERGPHHRPPQTCAMCVVHLRRNIGKDPCTAFQGCYGLEWCRSANSRNVRLQRANVMLGGPPIDGELRPFDFRAT